MPILKNCVMTDSGRYLCWDDSSKCYKFIIVQVAEVGEVSAEEAAKLVEHLSNQIK
jgi:hypothetical protein